MAGLAAASTRSPMCHRRVSLASTRRIEWSLAEAACTHECGVITLPLGSGQLGQVRRRRTRACQRVSVCVYTRVVCVARVWCVYTRVVCVHVCGVCTHAAVCTCGVYTCVVLPASIIQDLCVSVHGTRCSRPFSMFSSRACVLWKVENSRIEQGKVPALKGLMF